MNSKQGRIALDALRARFDVDLNMDGWESVEVEGGVALPDEIVAALGSAARQFGDETATVYEMESSGREFAPMTVQLNKDGFTHVRQSLLSHFDLVMVPASRKWAFVMSHELDGVLFGPQSFLASISVQVGA
jgi:hypothetical protein